MWRYFCWLLTQVAHYTADGCPELTNDPRLQPRFFPTQIFYRPRYRIFSIIHSDHGNMSLILTRWLLARFLVTHSITASSPSVTLTRPLVLTKVTSPDPDNVAPGSGRGARDPAMVSRDKPSRASLSVITWQERRAESGILKCQDFYILLFFLSPCVLRWIIILNVIWREEEENGRRKDLEVF